MSSRKHQSQTNIINKNNKRKNEWKYTNERKKKNIKIKLNIKNFLYFDDKTIDIFQSNCQIKKDYNPLFTDYIKFVYKSEKKIKNYIKFLRDEFFNFRHETFLNEYIHTSDYKGIDYWVGVIKTLEQNLLDNKNITIRGVVHEFTYILMLMSIQTSYQEYIINKYLYDLFN